MYSLGNQVLVEKLCYLDFQEKWDISVEYMLETDNFLRKFPHLVGTISNIMNALNATSTSPEQRIQILRRFLSDKSLSLFEKACVLYYVFCLASMDGFPEWAFSGNIPKDLEDMALQFFDECAPLDSIGSQIITLMRWLAKAGNRKHMFISVLIDMLVEDDFLACSCKSLPC
ncbi:MAG: hypothetical protein ACPLSN_03630 [Dictyoglomus turgidum]